MKFYFRLLFICVLAVSSIRLSAYDKFTALEQQQISIETPGLFKQSDAFAIDFSILGKKEYSFPLPIGKANVLGNGDLEIVTTKGDAVKAMFNGTVRLSRNNPSYGNVVVIRHDNGLETVYAHNAQNLVKVGQKVNAGQSVAIVGGDERRTFCTFFIMINGRKVNPETILDVNNHHLRKQTLLCEKKGSRINLSVLHTEKNKRTTGRNNKDKETKDNFDSNGTFKWNLANLEKGEWAYPLPGSHVISPYGGRRNHSGVDIKTKANDKILAAFDGVVTRSCSYFGYGNCIVIKHDNGLETLYSHQSKNFVKVGDKVKAGQVIGLTGRTGRATTEHLHFEIHYKGRRINPALIFDHQNNSIQQSTLTFNKNGRVTSQKNYYAKGK